MKYMEETDLQPEDYLYQVLHDVSKKIPVAEHFNQEDHQ